MYSPRQLAVWGLASQGRATVMANEMTDEECGWIAATMVGGLATTETKDACLRAVKSYYERNKATGDEAED